MNRSPVRFRQEAPEKIAPDLVKYRIGGFLVKAARALGYTFGYTSRNDPTIDLFIFDPRHRKQLRRRESLAARLKHERRHPQFLSELERATRPPSGLHERLKRDQARRRYLVHFALAGDATRPPLARFEVYELMRESATPLHLKQALIEPDKVPPIRLATSPVKARELHAHSRERGMQMVPRVIKTHPPTVAGG